MDLNDKSNTNIFRRIEMAKLFKVLANVTACILFLGGVMGMISRMYVWFAVTGFFGTDMSQLALQFVYIAIWFVAAVVVMKLSQMLK